MSDVESIRAGTTATLDNPKADEYKSYDQATEQLRKIAVYGEKFKAVTREIDDLKSGLSKINDKIENLQAFKNKMLGIGITIGIVIGFGVTFFARYLFNK